jgi:alpha-amylase
MPKGKKEIVVKDIFADGAIIQDYYSGQQITVAGGKVVVDSEFGIVLLGK